MCVCEEESREQGKEKEGKAFMSFGELMEWMEGAFW